MSQKLNVEKGCLLSTNMRLVDFITLFFWTGSNASGNTGSAQTNPGVLGMGGGATVLPAFEYRGTWIPILNVTVQGSAKAT